MRDSHQPEGCPLCGASARPRYRRHGFRIADCSRCGHRFAADAVGEDHVARVYADAYFEGGGAGYDGYLRDAAVLRERGRWYGELLERHVRPGTVLDVGAAAGFFLQGLLDRGWSGMGVEPNASMAAHAREKLGLDVRTGTLETFETEQVFDLVALMQVVAHFVDPRAALAAAASRVAPGGHLLVETWDRKSLCARCLGRAWHEYSPPSVLHWFTSASLRALVEPLGLTFLARGHPRRRISIAHARSLLRYKYAGSVPGRAALALLRPLPDRWSVPYPGDDLFWMLFRRLGGADRGVHGGGTGPGSTMPRVVPGTHGPAGVLRCCAPRRATV